MIKSCQVSIFFWKKQSAYKRVLFPQTVKTARMDSIYPRVNWKGSGSVSRLEVNTKSRAQAVVEGLYKDVERRIAASPPGLCPVDMALNFLTLCHAQTCGKCVPCRVGLSQLKNLLHDVLDGKGTAKTVQLIEKTAEVIANSADCAIGTSAAEMVLQGVRGFRDDYLEHVLNHRCLGNLENPVPCVALCPAGVDIPGYIALVREGRCDDAVKLIRKDNPFATACAYICEHPCEARCRRNMVDDAINIRGLKRYAVDNAGQLPAPKRGEPTGKSIGIIGGGPSGLSAAYYLAIMGHQVTVYEKRKKLGGMLRYGIPDYRLPRTKLDAEIEHILSVGIEAHTNVDIGKDIGFDALQEKHDCLYIAIGAHTDKKIGIEGEDLNNVVSAVEILRGIGDGDMPDFTGKNVVVVGGGNVAMDCVRSSIRLGAEKVTCVYRRREVDMTALAEEVHGAVAEGAELLTLHAPLRIESDGKGNAAALIAQPQMPGEMDKGGRPRPTAASLPEVSIPADVVIVAIGQGIETRGFESAGVTVNRGTIEAPGSGELRNMDGVFAGGDCVTGPATVIRAIAAGKVAAANIDEHLGFNHVIETDVEVPHARFNDRKPTGRVNIDEREASERKNDFVCIECEMTEEGAKQESSRCLRCDHFGYGIFKGGRKERW